MERYLECLKIVALSVPVAVVLTLGLAFIYSMYKDFKDE